MKDLFPCYTAVLLFDPSTVVVEGSGKNKPQYRTEQRAPTDEDFERHLKGDVSLGLSPLCEDSKIDGRPPDPSVAIYGMMGRLAARSDCAKPHQLPWILAGEMADLCAQAARLAVSRTA